MNLIAMSALSVPNVDLQELEGYVILALSA